MNYKFSFFKPDLSTKNSKTISTIVINLLLIFFLFLYFFQNMENLSLSFRIKLKDFFLFYFLILIDIFIILFLKYYYFTLFTKKKISKHIFFELNIYANILGVLSNFLSLIYKFKKIKKLYKLSLKNFFYYQFLFTTSYILNIFIVCLVAFALNFNIYIYLFLFCTFIIYLKFFILKKKIFNFYFLFPFFWFSIFIEAIILLISYDFFGSQAISLNQSLQIWSIGLFGSLINIFGFFESFTSWSASIYGFNFNEFFFILISIKLCTILANFLIYLFLILTRKFI
jgi:hypothetical protein